MTAVADETRSERLLARVLAWIRRLGGLLGRPLEPVRRLPPGDLAALRIWVISRCAVLALTWPAMWVMQGSSKAARPWLGLWQNWDAVNLQAIAQYGYFGPAGHAIPHQVAFFPGFPVALAIVHLFIRQWTVSGLLISFVAGGFAVVALNRIAETDYARGSGSRAVTYLVAAPAAIFLVAGYTEALFLACALWAWVYARQQQRWLPALALAGAATFIRVNGLFLIAAIALEIVLRGGERRVRALAYIALALAPLAGYELYLRLRTGDWLAWQHAETAGWDRRFTNPVTTFHTTWTAGLGHEFPAPIAFPFQLEIAAVAAGIIATILLLRSRRWPEAVYAGLTIIALATSIWYESVPRALLLLWPVWCGVAAFAVRHRWVGQLYLALSAPIAAVIGLLFLTGNWAG
jgi:hypothetical protein